MRLSQGRKERKSMSQRRPFLILTLCCLAAARGCTTHRALRRSTVRQAETVMDIQQQQVLDNLAKFVHDPYAIPSFALATSGVSGVTDSGNAGTGIGWVASGFNAVGIDLGGGRSVDGNWTMTPITDPRKLELMRCAYQRVLANCGVAQSAGCLDCTKRFNKFYTGKSHSTKINDDGSICYECENGELKNLVPQASDAPCVCSNCSCEDSETILMEGEVPVDCEKCSAPSSGIVTSECLHPSCCWFRKSCNKRDVPKCCQLVGHYCGTYVWVPRGPGRDKLAHLTIAILDYAINEEQTLPMKEVTAYLTSDGSPTTEECAHFVVKAIVSTDTPNKSVTKKADANFGSVEASFGPDDVLMESQRNLERIPDISLPPKRRTPTPGAGLLQLQRQQLNTLP